MNEQIYIQEARKEVLVILDKHYPDRLTALEEAGRVIQREVIRERANPRRNANWDADGNVVSPG